MIPEAPSLTPSNIEHAIQMSPVLPRPDPTLPHLTLPHLTLPREDLLTGPREDYINICVPLYEASIKGDWKSAEAIINRRPELVRFSITENKETALHVAASAKSTKFVENLVNKMQKDDLVLQNKNYNTALCLAAAAGTVKMAECMVNKNKAVLITQGSNGMMPLYMAALFRNRELVKYLYDQSKKLEDDHWTDLNRGWLLVACLQNDMFDIALDILKHHPKVHNSKDALQILAGKPAAFEETNIWILSNIFPSFIRRKWGADEKKNQALEALTRIWNYVLQQPVADISTIIRGPREEVKNVNGILIRHKHRSRALFLAARTGNSKFIIQLIRSYPDLIWKTDDHGRSIFHVAVKHRHECVYNILYELGSMKDLITPLKDEKGNTMLHLAARKAKPDRLRIVSGVALQMQRELQWFEEVKKMIPPSYIERKNNKNITAQELFSLEHKELVDDGEKWMKDTASQCMVVAALIATIVFAAAFTVPGGYTQDNGQPDNGIPVFIRKAAFMVFVISDAVSLFSSSTSILMFLSILTARYREEDFLKSLPTKLMIGLATLFFSITTMMVSFSASFFVIYTKNFKWAPILITALAGVPVISYALLQYHLLTDVVRSTFGSSYIFKPKKHALY